MALKFNTAIGGDIFQFLLLDEAIAYRAVFVIVSEADGGNGFGDS